MYDITIPEDSSSNCFDSVFYSLLKYFNFDYEAYNIRYFYTDYYNSIAHCIYRGKPYGRNILRDIYNIDSVFRYRNKSGNLFEIVCASLNNSLVGVIIDPYYCYWSPFYQKSHFSHMVLIVDINYRDKKYVCFDVHFNTIGYVEVDFDMINKNFEQYCNLHFEKAEKVQIELMIDKIRIILNSFNNNLDVKKTEMIDYFLKNGRKTLFNENIETSVSLINLMWIAEDKRHFPIALRYIETKIDKSVFSPIYELLLISQQKFLLLRSVLIKYAISGYMREDNIRNIINQIFDTDTCIIEQMKNILEDKL